MQYKQYIHMPMPMQTANMSTAYSQYSANTQVLHDDHVHLIIAVRSSSFLFICIHVCVCKRPLCALALYASSSYGPLNAFV